MLEVRNLTKEYPAAAGLRRVLTEVDITVDSGEAASIIGPSGSGKSTLLYIMGALEPPTSGAVRLDNENPFTLDEKGLSHSAMRSRFVFQDHHLLPQCTVLENVLVPTLVTQTDASAEDWALELLEQVGLSPRLKHRPYALSGGEKHRVALARALIMKPRLLLCDEPTGNLDGNSTKAVMDLLLKLHKTLKNILVLVTHNMEIAQNFDLRFRLADTRLHRI
jgi:lipoprotein-releasing system ATP-binding protein